MENEIIWIKNETEKIYKQNVEGLVYEIDRISGRGIIIS